MGTFDAKEEKKFELKQAGSFVPRRKHTPKYILGNQELKVGDWITLKAGEPVKMQVLFGEWEGGTVAASGGTAVCVFSSTLLTGLCALRFAG